MRLNDGLYSTHEEKPLCAGNAEIKELISISDDEFETNECKNIAIGKVLEAIRPFVSDLKYNSSVISFIENATKSERSSTKKKAEQLLKKGLGIG